MKKKLLSIFLSLSLIFSSIASMSVAFAEENSSTEKVVQQDGIEVRMDMKAGSSLYMAPKHWLTNPNPSWKEYFEDNANNKEAELLNYNGNQLMKIVIEIPKKEGLVINNINHKQNDAVPDNIKQNFPEYFGWKENDKGNNQYNFYFRKNGNYNFIIEYTLNKESKQIELSYSVTDLLDMDINFRGALLEYVSRITSNKVEYLTKNFLEDESEWPGGIVIKKGLSFTKNAPLVKSLNGIQYMGNNLKELHLSWEDIACSDSRGGFINLEKNGIEKIALAEKNYENLREFRITELEEKNPYIPENSYTSNLITKCVAKMPNLEAFYCEGSGFNNFKVFEGLEGNKLNDIWCGNNGVTSVDGIQNHIDLNHIKIRNTTAGKNAGLPQNGVFDLSPFEKCDLGGKCLAMLQEIDLRKVMENKGYKDYKVLAVKANDKVKIELPMPIDIDSTLTDVTNNEVIAKYGNETIKCISNENNGKKYIEIDNTAFGGKVVEDIENIEFSFKFNNYSGVDERTKGLFNGVVNFKASFNPTAKKEYRATYDFKSITEGKGLPESVTKLLPVDNTEYNEGDTITAIKPNYEEVEDGNGKWIFKDYDSESKVASKDNADENNNIKFVGKWEYVENEAKKYKVSYEFINATNEDNITGVELDKLTLPNEITKLLPNNTENNKEYSVGEEVDALKAAELKDKSIVVKYQNKDKEIDTYLEWKFDGYYVEDTKSDKLTIKKDGENKFVGKWICKDVDLEEYKFESDSSKTSI